MYCDEGHIQRRLLLIDGFARESNIDRLPLAISKQCDIYCSYAIYWRIGTKTLEYLLSDHAEFTNNIMRIGTFTFILALRNEKGSIIFEIIPLKTPSQCKDRIYCELYCVETQTQYKRSHLFDAGIGLRTIASNENSTASPNSWFDIGVGLYRVRAADRYSCCKWSPFHLTETQCKNKKRLTFALYMNILNESECQMSLPSHIEYKWNLIINEKLKCNTNKNCKIYSPNFGENCWCLWYKKSDSNAEDIIVGLQLLKLPNNRRNGIIFNCVLDYEGNDKQIEFTYFLDLRYSEVKIAKIANFNSVSWIKTGINLNVDANRKRRNTKLLIRMQSKRRNRVQSNLFSVVNRVYPCSLLLSFFNLNALYNYRLISRTFYLACHWITFVSSSIASKIQRRKSRQYLRDVDILQSRFRF